MYNPTISRTRNSNSRPYVRMLHRHHKTISTHKLITAISLGNIQRRTGTLCSMALTETMFTPLGKLWPHFAGTTRHNTFMTAAFAKVLTHMMQPGTRSQVKTKVSTHLSHNQYITHHIHQQLPPKTHPPPPPVACNQVLFVAEDEQQDNTSLTTMDYDQKLPLAVYSQYKVPRQEDMPQGVSTISGNSSGSSIGLPFLSAGSDKALPCYIGKEKEDINKFVYKLKIFGKIHQLIIATKKCQLHH